MRGRTVAERNRRLSLPLHRDGGGPSLAKAPISFTLISASFFLCYLFSPSRPVEPSFSPFSIAGSPIGARVVVMKLA